MLRTVTGVGRPPRPPALRSRSPSFSSRWVSVNSASLARLRARASACRRRPIYDRRTTSTAVSAAEAVMSGRTWRYDRFVPEYFRNRPPWLFRQTRIREHLAVLIYLGVILVVE